MQDAKFEQLLNEKRKYNSGIVPNNVYRFQIFSGSNDEAKKGLIDFKKEFKGFAVAQGISMTDLLKEGYALSKKERQK